MSNREQHAGGARGRRFGKPRRSGVAAAALALVVATGCEVVNPGPVDDAYLADPASQPALVNGAGRRLVEAVNNLGYTGALVAREIFPGGQTGSFGHDVLTQAGYIQPGSYGGHWSDVQQARYIAEDAIRRFTEPGATVQDSLLFKAYNWAGYAYRVLGENYCEIVLDKGGVEPAKVAFTRAEAHFTNAIAKATNAAQKNQALAGRAQVRLWLKDFVGADADAAAVIASNAAFEFKLDMNKIDPDTRNFLFYAAAGVPYIAYSVIFTFYDDYYTQTGDPRTPWATTSQQFAGASLQGYGQVPFKQQRKYLSEDDDVRLASAREMVLIRAEVDLEEGRWQDAMAKINSLRTSKISNTTGQPLAPWTATDLNDAWRYLKRERGIEMWLEARRLGDLRRWEDNNTPGNVELPNFEARSNIFSQNPRSRCFDIPNSERERNPLVPLVI